MPAYPGFSNTLSQRITSRVGGDGKEEGGKKPKKKEKRKIKGKKRNHQPKEGEAGILAAFSKHWET